MPRERAQAVDVRDIEDQTLAAAQLRRGGLREEQGRAQVAADQIVELRRRDRADRRRIEGGGVVDQAVEPAEGTDHGVRQGLPQGRIGEIAMEHRGGSGPRVVHAADEQSGVARGMTAMDGDRRAGRMESAGDRGADAPCGARDQHDLPGERRWDCGIHDAWRRYHGSAALPC